MTLHQIEKRDTQHSRREMNRLKKNCSAFPVLDALGEEGILASPDYGMTLRDYFAGQALVGIVTHSSYNVQNDVVLAYQYADAMLAGMEKIIEIVERNRDN